MSIVFLTDTAKEHMSKMLLENSKGAVRLSLKGGGCAGFKYDWTLEDSPEEQDEKIDIDNGYFIVDPSSILFLIGSTIDYKKEVFGSYFEIMNPASKNSCGCGESVGF